MGLDAFLHGFFTVDPGEDEPKTLWILPSGKLT
jgi:hypothetical protein